MSDPRKSTRSETPITLAKPLVLPILYEDDDILVIDKPSGVVVNRAQTVHTSTVQDWVEQYLHLPSVSPSAPGAIRKSYEDKTAQDVFNERSGVAHRIDKETSGCLLIAKTPQVLDKLLTMFREREMKKTYLAIVHGEVLPTSGTISAPVGRLPWNSERFGILPGGKESVTNYKALEVISRESESYTLVECSPQSGRTHQIRIHLKYINHPIVGDYLYAGRKTSRDDRLWAPRVMLHAWKLSFTHPTTAQTVAIESPIPDDMKNIVHSK